MVPIALILLAIVILFSVAVVVSNPVAVDLSIFGAHIPVSTPAVYFTGAGAMLVVLVALFLLRTGARRSIARRKEVRTLKKEVKAQNAAGASTQNASGATAQSAGGRQRIRHSGRDAGRDDVRWEDCGSVDNRGGVRRLVVRCRVIPCWVIRCCVIWWGVIWWGVIRRVLTRWRLIRVRACRTSTCCNCTAQYDLRRRDPVHRGAT